MFTTAKLATALLLGAPLAALGTATLDATAPAGAAAASAAVFQPVSVTFVSSSLGWALGRTSCPGGTCLALRKTVDGGGTWSALPLPPAVLAAADKTSGGVPHVGAGLQVRFANASQGWIFGALPSTNQFNAEMKAVVWSTHNGGTSWQADSASGLSPNQSSILDLEASDGRAYVLAQQG